jgi:hypothetical protein
MKRNIRDNKIEQIEHDFMWFSSHVVIFAIAFL